MLVAELKAMAVTVLIVDDDVTLRWLLCKQLDQLGLQADSAANGREAFERVKKWPYQVILMDCHMLDMDGYDATRLIRQRERELHQEPVPIIALTADPDREKCLEVGMSDHLQKPINLEDLSAILDKWKPHAPPRSQQKPSPPPDNKA